MSSVGLVIVGYLLIFTLHDLWKWGVRGANLAIDTSQVDVVLNDLPGAAAKVIVTWGTFLLTTCLGIFHAGAYIWLANKGFAPLVGATLALINLAYVIWLVNQIPGRFIALRLPESYPNWWRWAVIAEGVLGIPYLSYILLAAIV